MGGGGGGWGGGKAGGGVGGVRHGIIYVYRRHGGFEFKKLRDFNVAMFRKHA